MEKDLTKLLQRFRQGPRLIRSYDKGSKSKMEYVLDGTVYGNILTSYDLVDLYPLAIELPLVVIEEDVLQYSEDPKKWFNYNATVEDKDFIEKVIKYNERR